MKCINETTTRIELSTGLVDSVLLRKILLFPFLDISEKYLQYFLNDVYLYYMHINLKGLGKILLVSVLTNFPICKFLNFTAVFTNKKNLKLSSLI